MDILRLYQQQGSWPFPFCLATVTITQKGPDVIGECFLLVENGKAFFNGKRVVLPAEGNPHTWQSHMLQQASKIVEKMYGASLRQGVRAAPHIQVDVQFDEVATSTLADLWRDGSFHSHVKWISNNAASPQLRQVAGVLGHNKT